MQQPYRSRGRFAVLAAAFVAALALAAPSAASAASLGQTDWTLRSGWVNYVTNPLWKNAQPITTSWASLGANTYGIPVVSGTSTSTVRHHSGSIRFDVDLHLIHVSIGNLEATVSGSTVTIEADVSYDPLLGAVVADRRDILTLDLSAVAGEPGDDGETVYTDVPAILTAGGAEVFNGGANGSYAAGQAFGDISIALP